ncbi:ATP-binding protein [Nostoc sp. CENA67]|uniref:ATP-binding protein n=1 Tax=Amazonocrinis nigriterrae CENA67 TaxID=2794033 RepID=A0A8J7HUG9_9NOST|nr:ATP-binding protein [Amazonocrinis nigriterrae]MBH8562694.1 ATP-binding protein [Amazonocrinis nigriterrae CENA67]
MYIYKLTRIVFNNGEEVKPGNLTVIIGPNNAGKSRILKDIAQKTTISTPLPNVVVNDVDWTTPQNLQELREAYSLERHQDEYNNWVFRTLAPELSRERQAIANFWTEEDEVIYHFLSKKSLFAEHFGLAMVAFITTEHRLKLVKEAASAEHERQEANLLQTMYNAGTSLENEIQKLVKRAFGKEIKLDFTVPQRLLFRVGDDFSLIPSDPRDARQPMQQYDKLDDQGDGIRSFVGITTALLATKRNVFLIDEPEAFLHPPQAFRIGEFIAQQANSERQIILATHSADLLRGLLSKTTDLTIIRIDRRDKINYFNTLDPNRLQELVNDPLLSSSRVLDGLFYSGVVVVEADSDGRFYQTASNKRKNDIDLYFVNADNKQTVPRITTLYRNMGVRCVGIVDFDVLNDSAEFKKQLEALDFSEESITPMLTIREEIAKAAKELPCDERLEKVKEQMKTLLASLNEIQGKAFGSDGEAKFEKEKLLSQIERRAREIAASTKNWNDFKEKGRAALPAELQFSFDELWKTCSEKGLFINPCGELESMLTHAGLAYTTDKRVWITKALSMLPRLEVNDNEYPWKFIKEIQDYLMG